MSVENEVKNIIQQNYKSLKAFSEKIGIPYTTVDSIFKRGFNNSSISNMIKISDELNLDVESLNKGIIKKKTNSEARDHILLEKYHGSSDETQKIIDKILDMPE